MSPGKIFHRARFLIPGLILSLLVSCSASQHAGVTNVKTPLISETDENIWYLYYQDIFDAYQGEVAPPLEKYPTASHRAYNRAKEEWDKKVEDKKATGKPLVILAIGLAIFIIAAALLVPTINRPSIKI